MKYLLLVAFFASAVFSFSQEVPMEVTPEMIVKIKADIEAEIPAVKKQLQKDLKRILNMLLIPLKSNNLRRVEWILIIPLME
jgi:hypothetical protein